MHLTSLLLLISLLLAPPATRPGAYQPFDEKMIAALSADWTERGVKLLAALPAGTRKRRMVVNALHRASLRSGRQAQADLLAREMVPKYVQRNAAFVTISAWRTNPDAAVAAAIETADAGTTDWLVNTMFDRLLDSGDLARAETLIAHANAKLSRPVMRYEFGEMLVVRGEHKRATALLAQFDADAISQEMRKSLDRALQLDVALAANPRDPYPGCKAVGISERDAGFAI